MHTHINESHFLSIYLELQIYIDRLLFYDYNVLDEK